MQNLVDGLSNGADATYSNTDSVPTNYQKVANIIAKRTGIRFAIDTLHSIIEDINTQCGVSL